jgi:hypothetical protein
VIVDLLCGDHIVILVLGKTLEIICAKDAMRGVFMLIMHNGSLMVMYIDVGHKE